MAALAEMAIEQELGVEATAAERPAEGAPR
jgi:hypothetical protein